MMTHRIDLFTLVHKGLRWWIGDVSARLGATDFSTPAAGEVLSGLEELLLVLDSHARHEDTFIAPLLQSRAPLRAKDWDASHRRLEGAEAVLRAAIVRARAGGPSSVSANKDGLAIYRAFNRFAADMLNHLDEEETELMPLLWSTCSDDELGAVMMRFKESAGAEAAAFHRRAALAYAPAERTMLGL